MFPACCSTGHTSYLALDEVDDSRLGSAPWPYESSAATQPVGKVMHMTGLVLYYLLVPVYVPPGSDLEVISDATVT